MINEASVKFQWTWNYRYWGQSLKIRKFFCIRRIMFLCYMTSLIRGNIRRVIELRWLKGIRKFVYLILPGNQIFFYTVHETKKARKPLLLDELCPAYGATETRATSLMIPYNYNCNQNCIINFLLTHLLTNRNLINNQKLT